jgi:hypothetical protein
VYFGFQYYFIPSGDLGYQVVHQHDDWAAYYGNSPGDTLRGLFYAYDGNSNVRSSNDVGDPDEVSGEFLSPQYPGFGVLHADISTTDRNDNPNQPSTVIIKPRNRFAQPLAPPIGNDDAYTELSLGRQDKGSTEARSPNPYDSEVTEPVGLLSFGPYDIPFGESINIVVYDVVGALSERDCINYGQNWKNGNLEWNGLNGDAAKNALIATGKDSIFKHAYAAEYAWSIGMEDIPDPPPTPDNFNIVTGPGRIELSWDSVEDEEDPDTGIEDFAGYRVYRAEGKVTNLYKKIWECGGNSGVEVQNFYDDETVERGKFYFYAVTAFDDGTQNTTGLYPGQSLESSMYYNRNYQYAGEAIVGAYPTLDSVYVVPNPYHIRGLAFGGGGKLDPTYYPMPEILDKLSFFGLPYKATIRIFTMSGNLVQTIQHPNPENSNSVSGAADEAWFNISQSYQIIKSGVYIYHVEGWDRNGKALGSTTGKFVIIR